MVRYDKVYVDMLIRVDSSGKSTPVAVKWDTGKIYKIQKVTGERNSPPEHVGAILTRRYDVIISGAAKKIYLETQTNRWFVEKPV